MKAIHLCLIAPVPPPYGGVGNWVLLLRNFTEARADIAIDIVNTAPRSRGIDGRTLWDRVVAQGALMLKQQKDLKMAIKKDRPDVVHITTSGQLAVIRDILYLRTARKAQIPAVYHIRFGRVKEIAEKNTLEWKLIARAMRMATRVMAIDRTTLEAVKEHVPAAQTVYVPNPIDIAKLPEPAPGHSKTVMYLGWIVNTKGIEELLVTWSNIHKKYPEWTLKLVGPCRLEYYDSLKSRFSFEGVVFAGEKSHGEAMDILNSSDIFVLPSYTEGFPNVILEAMALAKPIIATRVGAIPDILADGCGLLIDAKEPAPLGEALDELMADPHRRKTMGELACQKLKDNYTIDMVFARYMEEWRSLAGNK